MDLAYQRWGWYFFQYISALYIDVCLKYEVYKGLENLNNECIKTNYNVSKFVFQSDFLEEIWNKYDFFLEWNEWCFEDYNLLIALILKFSKNINKDSCIHQLVVVHDWPVLNDFLILNRWLSSWSDYVFFSKLVISLVRKLHKRVAYLATGDNKRKLWHAIIEYLKSWDPSYLRWNQKFRLSQEIKNDIFFFVKLCNNIYILDSLSCGNIYSILENWRFTKEEIDYTVMQYYKSSIDLTPILKTELDYSRYLKYDNLCFSSGPIQKPNDMEEITDWKFFDL